MSMNGDTFSFVFLNKPSNVKPIKRVFDETITGNVAFDTAGIPAGEDTIIEGEETTLENLCWYIRKGPLDKDENPIGPVIAYGGNPTDGQNPSGGQGDFDDGNEHEESVAFTISESGTYYITTGSSNYPSELWTCISSVSPLGEPSGGFGDRELQDCVNFSVATVHWAQGHGAAPSFNDDLGLGAGALSDKDVFLVVPEGQTKTFYFNMYDKYDDGWVNNDATGGPLSVTYNEIIIVPGDPAVPPTTPDYTALSLNSDGNDRFLSARVYPETTEYRVYYRIKLENTETSTSTVTIFPGINTATTIPGIEDINHKILSIPASTTQVFEGYLDLTGLVVDGPGGVVGNVSIGLLAKTTEEEHVVKFVANYPHELWCEPLKLITI